MKTTRKLVVACALLMTSLPANLYAQTSPAPAAGPTPLVSGTSGTLTGGEANYSLFIPGNNITASVTMQYMPNDLSGAVGLSLIGSQGEIPAVVQCVGQGTGVVTTGIYVTPAGTTSPVPVLSPGTQTCSSNQTLMTAGVTQTSAETYRVKVYNKNAAVPISYTLTISGIPLPCLAATPAGGSTPATASTLGQPVTSQLPGDIQGRFAYYKFHYVGDGSTIMVVMFYNPTNDTTRGGPQGFNPGLGATNPSHGSVGFNIYLGSNIAAPGQLTPNDGQVVAGFSSQTAGDYYVQVFNYTPNLLINYTLSVSGLQCAAASPAPSSVAAPGAAPAASQSGKTSDAAIPLGASVQGSLSGSAPGSFAYYRFNYDGQTQPNIAMTFTPSDPLQSAGSGFNIYGPNSFSLQGAGNGLGPGNLGATLPGGVASGPYYVQVYNYLNTSTISFTLQRS